MILAIDIGNSITKFALFKKRDLILVMPVATKELKRDLKWHWCVEKAKEVILTSVVPSQTSFLKEEIKKKFKKDCYTLSDMNLNLKIDYLPDALGEDRICNAYAVYRHYKKDGVIFDLGTAITVSVVSKEGKFLGGSIAPGILTSSFSLLKNTANLKRYVKSGSELLNFHSVPQDTLLGKDPLTGMKIGRFHFLKGGIEHLIREYKKELKKRFLVFLTGGFSWHFSKFLKGVDIFDPFLTLKGLVEIYYSKE